MITQKYPYRTINRVQGPDGRKYQIDENQRLPSVTTILSATKDMTGLNEWRKRVGSAMAKKIVTEAANVGTSMHKYLEAYIETGQWPAAKGNVVHQQSYLMAEIIRDNALTEVDEIWGSEVNLWFPDIYAGTTDLVGLYKNNPSIIDFKQSNKLKKPEWVEDYFLQIAMYGMAHNEVYGTDIREGHVFMCTRDLIYQQFDIWPDEWDHWCNKAWDRAEQYYQTLAVS